MVIIDKRRARGGGKTAASDDIYSVLTAYVNDMVHVGDCEHDHELFSYAVCW